MTTRTFSLALSDTDRLAILSALGFSSMYLHAKMTPELHSDWVTPIDRLIATLSSAPGHDSSSALPQSGTDAARAVLAPPAPTDHFAASRKGDIPVSAPDGAELSSVKIVSAQPTHSKKAGGQDYLAVIFAAGTTADGRVRPAGKASCFDKQLWRFIQNRENQAASLWIMESGNYLNIVGVRQ